MLLLVATVAAVLHWETERLEAANTSSGPVRVAPRYRPGAAFVPAFDRDRLPSDMPLALPERIREGETLGQVLARFGLDSAEVELAVTAAAEHVDLRRLKTGERYAAAVDGNGVLVSFDLRVEGRGQLELRPGAAGWASDWRPSVESRVLRTTSGTLTSNLEAAMREAGSPAAVAYGMADVLQWDVDFTRDLKRGDTYAALYEEVYLDRRYHRVGDIQAVVLENGGRRLEAYRWGDGYYDGEGRPLRKLFLRSPLRFSRISSSFSARRLHPVLKRYRPHYGVDYAAPVGTPVRATAAGTVQSAGWDGGGGKTVKIRHTNGFLTAYLHLSRFADGVRPGRRVGQGEVIGYVGATGLASGPHLDYRVQRKGRWIDPATLRSEPQEPIPVAEMTSFLERRDLLREGLSGGPYPDADQIAALDAGIAPAGGR